VNCATCRDLKGGWDVSRDDDLFTIHGPTIADLGADSDRSMQLGMRPLLAAIQDHVERCFDVGNYAARTCVDGEFVCGRVLA
jgi:hypothetical protein